MQLLARVALDHAVLDLDGAAHGIDNAAELNDCAVAGPLDGAPMMQGVAGSIRSLRSARNLASVRSSSALASLL